MAAVLSGKRALILTSTKALQDQIMADFSCFDIVDVRGQSAYPCLHEPTVTCEEGVCHIGYECLLKTNGCLYYDAVRRAKTAQIVVTNYAFWLTSARIGDTIGKFDLLILDEAHDAPEWVTKSISASIPESISKDINKTVPDGNDPSRWKMWSSEIIGIVQSELKRMESKSSDGYHSISSASKAMRLRKYERSLVNIIGLSHENMTVDRESLGGYAIIEPISAVGLAEKMLFRDINKVILTSATVRMKTLKMMGVEDSKITIHEYPSSFPSSRRPVIYIPTVRVQHDMTEMDIHRWISQMDNIMRTRKDRKGIIHSVSYARSKQIMAISENKNYMITHDRRSLKSAIQHFRDADPPCIMVSPSMVTGYDFPYDQCEYQIISKIGFPDTRSVSMQARVKRDNEYAYYITMLSIVQASGRGMRSKDDQCEVFIVDDHWSWFVNRWKKFAPAWFLESCTSSRTIPKPLTPLIHTVYSQHSLRG